MRHRVLLIVLVIAALGLPLSACSSTATPGGPPASFRVLATAGASTDLAARDLGPQAEGDYRAVTLFVASVDLVQDGAPRTVAAYAEPLELELLGLRDLRAELAEAELPSGVYWGAQLRLVLAGAELTVEGEDGQLVRYDLETPSAERSGYKLQLADFTLEQGGATLLLDFDPEKSVVETGGGRYLLRPVVRASFLAP